jgi:AraC-like DNA-binding protein
MVISRLPSPPLSRFVRSLWYADGAPRSVGRERHMPDGTAALLIALDDTSRGSSDDFAIFKGPRSCPTIIGTAAPVPMIGVHFTSGGAAPFLQVPVSELANAHAPLRDVGDAGVATLRERLLSTDSAHARLALLEKWLTLQTARQETDDEAIAWAVGAIERRPHVRMRDLTACIGHSSRWFIQRFSEHVGLTPKVFSRIRRFQHAIERMHGEPDSDLADLALSLGYFDQAHFAHDFRAIAGMTPTAYLSARTAYPNHVALVD